VQLDQGIWYQRETGQAFAARERPGVTRSVEVRRLHPNTLEELGQWRTLSRARFEARYCRRADLG
jgi:hypothetical protein